MPKELAVILLVVGAFYARVTMADLCGFDDFLELHRAAFEDTRDPSGIFTTTHFGTSRYRPVQRLMTYAAWQFKGSSALALRLRNLGFHLFAVSAVFGIAWLLTRSRLTATAASLLFGLHPLANQSIVAAVWGNTTAYGLMLASFFLFLYSLQTERRWVTPLLASFVLLAAAIFTYEGAIVLFGFMFLYLLVRWKTVPSPLPTGYLTVLGAGTAAVLGMFLFVRTQFVQQPISLVAPRILARNVLMYAGALAMPVDSVLANAVFGVPLPPDLKLTKGLIGGAVLIVLALGAAAFVLLRRPAGRQALRALNGWLAAWLAICLIASLSPFLLIMAHPSETYLYLPSALYALLISILLRALLPTRMFVGMAVVLGMLFMTGVWIRNQRVASCGAVAGSILRQLPVAQWRDGPHQVLLADVPGGSRLRRYGIYGYDGIFTIDAGMEGLLAAQAALQMAAGNEALRAELTSAERMRMRSECTVPGRCFWVHSDGRIQDAAGK